MTDQKSVSVFGLVAKMRKATESQEVVVTKFLIVLTNALRVATEINS